MKRFLILAAAVATATSVGCANARYVQKMGDEGIVAIPNNTDAWPNYNRTEACRLIEQHVGPAYEIVEEKEVVTGTATTNNQDTNREATFNPDVPFLPAERQTTTTTTTPRHLAEYHTDHRKKVGGLPGSPRTGRAADDDHDHHVPEPDRVPDPLPQEGRRADRVPRHRRRPGRRRRPARRRGAGAAHRAASRRAGRPGDAPRRPAAAGHDRHHRQ